jgi:hypothetical protein
LPSRFVPLWVSHNIQSSVKRQFREVHSQVPDEWGTQRCKR